MEWSVEHSAAEEERNIHRWSGGMVGAERGKAGDNYVVRARFKGGYSLRLYSDCV